MPTAAKDYEKKNRDLDAIFAYLPVKEIIFIGPAAVGDMVAADAKTSANADRIRYINENDIIPFDTIKKVFAERVAKEGYDIGSNSKLGWYYQQFLKMKFCELSDEDYYLSWDADTIPLHKIDMFTDDDIPYFDIKTELMPGYFKTISSLLGMNKVCPKSFISEHMIFSVDLMKDLIAFIEKTDFDGTYFYEKIIYAMGLDNLKRGFSEFETYGTYVMTKYPDKYVYRDWRSLRFAAAFLDPMNLSEDDMRWLSESFEALSFENYHDFNPQLFAMFRNPEFRSQLSSGEFYQILLEEGYFGRYADGGILTMEGLFPA